ncbi:hypothetical protein SOCE26_073460 [Sorangium cellulosum]|uniref:Secreted protein n=1 Tax=Sorangium cellulosum TaxID=56 RepID=A0A2L0F2S8_SORCE|nr:hypothetical protein [Sorangium cellulosum]AUX45850.1 hypothetical protein SOCE26_073460 [Sorangium cellulosum]
MNARSSSPRRGVFFFTGLAIALASSAACTPPQAAQGTTATTGTAAAGREGDDCSTGALLTCPEGQVDGCAIGTTTQHRCVEAGPGGCLDIRAALVKCKESEVLTHEGCPEPAYMQRCAPRPAQQQQ